jgi:Cd2+/Zn2+-exporting ATPase
LKDDKSTSTPDEQDLCMEGFDTLLDKHRGIVAAEISSGHDVVLTYDPARASTQEIQDAAREVVPVFRQRFEKCTMRLQGRACEACAMKLERRAETIPGVRRARATFAGGVMSVTFDEAQLAGENVVEQVRKIGAPVKPYEAEEEAVSRTELVFTALTLVFLVAGIIAEKTASQPLVHHIIYALAYFFGGWFGVQASWQSLKERTIDVDLLMVLAALGAAYIGHPPEGATLLFLFSLSNVLQSYAMERTRKAIHSLMRLRPETALVKRDGETVSLPIDQLAVGDHIIVRPGERVPLDAVVVEGSTSLDEASVTGESMPVTKSLGEPVFAGTINQTGAIEAVVTKLAKDSTIARLIQMVEEAQSEKAKTQRWLDHAEQYYAMGVIGFTLALIIVPWLFGSGTFAGNFYRAMTVMVVASPCALIISTPATILSAIGGAARRGVLFKGGAHLEKTAGVDTVVFDKTGTLTTGQPAVTDVLSDTADALQLAASIEAKSEHPLAHAIVAHAKSRGVALLQCDNFQAVAGQGASGYVGGRCIAVGNARFFEKHSVPVATIDRLRSFQQGGKTAVIVAEMSRMSCEILGVIAIADTLREDTVPALRKLHEAGVRRVVMLTGDNHHVAAAIAREAGIDEFHADLRPEDKLQIVKQLKESGRVAMVGDGVNDAPALAAADVGIAMGAAGTDVAMETADVVLMSSSLRNVAFAIGVSRRARTVVFQNLAFALAVIVVLVINTLGIWQTLTGAPFPLTLGVIGHEGSTVLVCLNGLRLLLYDGKE